MPNIATRLAVSVGALSKKRRAVYMTLFALTARVWIDEVTEAVHRSRALDERLTDLEARELAREERDAAAVDAGGEGTPPAGADVLDRDALRARSDAAAPALAAVVDDDSPA